MSHHPQDDSLDNWNRTRDTIGLVAFGLLLVIIVLLFGGLL